MLTAGGLRAQVRSRGARLRAAGKLAEGRRAARGQTREAESEPPGGGARAARGDAPALFLEAALHYLVLAEHPDVRPQPGLARDYLERADAWLARAAEGADGVTQPRRLHG